MSYRSQSVSFSDTKPPHESKKRQLSAVASQPILKGSSICSHERNSSNVSNIEPINCSFEELLAKFALASGEIERLLHLNSITRKEVELWKRKYKECDSLLEKKTAMEIEMEENNVYKKKYENMKSSYVNMSKDLKALELILFEKDEELNKFKEVLAETGRTDQSKDGEMWKAKYVQLESDYISQLQELRDQTELVLRTQIEREVNVAFKYYEKEKHELQEACRVLNAKVNSLQEEIGFCNEEKDQALRQLGQLKGHLAALEKVKMEIEGDNTWLINEVERLKSFLDERNIRIENVEQVLQGRIDEIVELKELYSRDMAELNNEIEFYKEKLGSHKLDSRESPKKSSNISTNLELEDSPKGLMFNREKENQQSVGNVNLYNERERKTASKDYGKGDLAGLQQEIHNLREENNRLVEELNGQVSAREDMNKLIEINHAYEADRNVLLGEIEKLKGVAAQNSEMIEAINILQKEREDLLEKLKSAEFQLQESLIELQDKDQEIERNRIGEGEIEKYNIRARELVGENDLLKANIKEKAVIESNLRTELEVVTQRLNELASEKRYSEALETTVQQSTAKLETLEREVRYWKEQYEQEKGHSAQQRVEIESLSSVYAELLKKVIGEMGLQTTQEDNIVELILTRIREYKASLQRANQEIISLKADIIANRSSLSQERLELEERYSELNKSVDRIKGVMQEDDFDSLLKRIIESNIQMKILAEDAAFWRRKFEDKEKESEDAMQWIESELRANWAQKLEVELENHRNEVAAKEEELLRERLEHEGDIRTIKQGYKEVEENCLKLLERNKDLEVKVQDLLKEKELAEINSVKGVSQKLQEAEQRIMHQITDIVALNEKLASRDKEIEAMNIKYKALEKKSDQVIKDKIESLELQMKEELQREKRRINEEVQNAKIEAEEKSLAQKRKLEEVKQLEMEKKILKIENNKLVRDVEELKEELNKLGKQSDEKVNSNKVEWEKESQAQLGTKLKAIEAEFRGKVSFHEEQAKTLKAKIDDFTLKEVLYFIEMERLHAINSELLEDVNKLNKDCNRYFTESLKSQQKVEDLIKVQSQLVKEKEGRAKIDEIIEDLRDQVEQHEDQAQKLPAEEIKRTPFASFKVVESESFKSPTISLRSSIAEKKVVKSHYTSLKQSQTDLTDMTQKFESDKNAMENQLFQLKKIIETNKSDIRSRTEGNHDDKIEEKSSPKRKTYRIFS